MSIDKLVIDASTGDVSEEPFTPEETEERTERAPSDAAEAAALDVARTNASVIDQAITEALVRLQQLIDAPDVPTVPDGTLTTAALSNAMRQMRTAVQQNRDGAQEVAQVLKRTIRLVRGDFDDVD